MSIRSTFRYVMWTISLLLSSLACRAATSLILPDTPTSPPPATFTPMPVATETLIVPVTGGTGSVASCPVTLEDILIAASTPGDSREPDEERYLVTYSVTGEQISDPAFISIPVDLKDEQDDLVTQQKVWQYFAALIPEQNRGMIAEYAILTDGKDNILAAVAQTSQDPTRWVLQVDIADAGDYANLTFTIIHEFGHLLTLNADQVPPNENIFSHPNNDEIHAREAALCPNYFPGEGCSKPDSYINQFYQRFWSGVYNEWSAIDQTQDETAYYEQMSEFYRKYQDQFVSSYATTNPAEDVAESWAYFVLAPKPQGDSISDQKVLFFYEHPELVELRAQILNRLCTVFPE